MPLYHIIILAIVQGISEFLPVSSSGHLILTHALLHTGPGQPDYWGNTLTLDIAVHVGSLLAIILYFRKDIGQIILGGLDLFCAHKNGLTQRSKLCLLLIAATIPVVIIGTLLHIYEPVWARSLQVAAWSLLIFGIVLGVVDKMCPTVRTGADLRLKDVMIIGLAQCLALIPGTSRSGITMTAGRFLGLTRVEAARFSFLLGSVAIAGAGVLGAIDVFKNPTDALLVDIAVGIVVSCLAALGAMHILMKWLTRSSFMVFVYYRVALGILLLLFLYSGVLG